jgi:hypothetical protein
VLAVEFPEQGFVLVVATAIGMATPCSQSQIEDGNYLVR